MTEMRIITFLILVLSDVINNKNLVVLVWTTVIPYYWIALKAS